VATDPLRLLVAAADPLARAGLSALLADAPGCEVAGGAALGDGAELVRAADVHQAGVVVLDLGWSPGAALDAVAELAAAAIPLLVLVPDETAAADAWRAGARAVMPRDAAPGDLALAAHAAARGLGVFHPDVGPLPSPPPAMSAAPLVEPLTPREMDVLRLVARGLTNKAIAYHLDISDNTVKFHVNTILGKLGAASRTEAALAAARLGLVAL